MPEARAAVLQVDSNVTAAISALTLTGGSTSDYGGGLANAGSLTLTNVTVSGNRSKYAGGMTNGGTATLNDCTFTGNNATGFGGAMINFDGTLTMTNVTIEGNTALESAGVHLDGGVNTFTACTISGNTGSVPNPSFPNGVYISLAGTTTLVDTIVAGNTSSTGPSDVGGPGTAFGSNNLFGTGGSGGLTNGTSGNIVLTSLANLGLTPLGSFGGPTQTMALLPGSAAIGMGAFTSSAPTDQRGFVRGDSVDIGAFQTQPYLLVNTTVDGAGSPSGDLSLRQAVNLANALGAAETIFFDPTAFATPQTVTLDGSQLELSDTSGTESIIGPASGVTISAGGQSRVLQVDANVTAAISGLTISGGSMSGYGGGLTNYGSAALTDVTVSGNSGRHARPACSITARRSSSTAPSPATSPPSSAAAWRMPAAPSH